MDNGMLCFHFLSSQWNKKIFCKLHNNGQWNVMVSLSKLSMEKKASQQWTTNSCGKIHVFTF